VQKLFVPRKYLNSMDIDSSNGGDAQQRRSGEHSVTDPGVYVSLTYEKLDPTVMIGKVKSAKSGAVLVFAGRYWPERCTVIEG
jgi:hypothetical protein